MACAALGGSSLGADFAWEIRPILSAKCFACHGPDEGSREADLRLDRPEDSQADLGGYAAIVPGSPQESEALVRILEEDSYMRMPPPESGKSLSADEIELITRWISEGARYEPHWSFVRVKRPTTPETADPSAHPVDSFVRRRLEAEGLNQARPADPYTLLRRVYLDLIGLPPSPRESADFAADPSPAAYEAIVDRLLSSPRYGERWARLWLDLARYSDTNGYEKDRPRSMWLYRDWVIDSINADMPFDQFTIEQLAGDMLPEPTFDQLVATGFHRNTMVNEEGGIDPQEFRYLSVVDRVATTGATWMGLTLGCAQCHTHKYDPVTHDDYFSVFALLNNADELELQATSDDLKRRLDKHAKLVQQRESTLRERLLERVDVTDDATDEQRLAAAERLFEEWLRSTSETASCWRTVEPIRVETNLPDIERLEDGSYLVGGDVTNGDKYKLWVSPTEEPITALRLETLPHESLPRGGSGRRVISEDNGDGPGSFLLTELEVVIESGGGERRVPLAAPSATFAATDNEAPLAIDGRHDTGWSVLGRQLERQALVVQLKNSVRLQAGERLRVTLRHDSFYPAGIGRFRLATSNRTRPVVAHGLSDGEINALLTPEAARSEEQVRTLWEAFLVRTPLLAAEQLELAELKNNPPRGPSALVLSERHRDARVTHRRHRGEYLQTREAVEPGAPRILAPDEADQPSNRLEFARWLVNRDNPLTARVVVNRDWQVFFGQGLVKTSADFGMQGEYPTHPELLDWLAAEFMDNGWSRKRLHRLIVTSDTYKQSSNNSKSREADPENRLLARAPRIRLDAEIVRDVMLSISGLLSEKLGGPSVFPTQPAGITEAAYGPLEWVVSRGEDRYRRGLYTFNKRSAPYAAFSLFDGPSGENCTPRRNRSNTPLQALAMLNDVLVSESARTLASNALEAGGDEYQVAERLFWLATSRPPTSEEARDIADYANRQRRRIDAGELNASLVLNSGPERAWTFEEDAGGWVGANHASLTVTGGEAVVTCDGEDPFLRNRFRGSLGPYRFEVVAKAETEPALELYWTTEAAPDESGGRHVLLDRADDGVFVAEFSCDSPLTSLRLDTGSQPGVVRLASCHLAYGDGLFDYSSVEDPHRLAAWMLAARAVLNLDEVIMRP